MFVALGFTFRFMINLRLIFYIQCKIIQALFFTDVYLSIPAPSAEVAILPPVNCMILSKISCYMSDLFLDSLFLSIDVFVYIYTNTIFTPALSSDIF